MFDMGKSEFKALVGKNVKKQRIERGLSIGELAVLLDLTPMFIASIERGERGLTMYNLFKLAHVLDVPVEIFAADINGPSSQHSESYESICHKKLAVLTRGLSQSKLEFLISTVNALDDI